MNDLKSRVEIRRSEYELGVALAHSQSPNEAVSHFEKAIALKPSDWQAQTELAAVLRELGELVRAREAASRAELLKVHDSKLKRLAEKDKQAAELLRGGHGEQGAETYREMLLNSGGYA